jgi:mRNA interferase MazF
MMIHWVNYPLKIIVPVTDWKDHYDIAPWMIKIEPTIKNGLSKISSADCFQIRSVSQDRFVKKLGDLSEPVMDDIRIGLAKVLSIE